jgi:putative PIN family toxin of toxin-antitoxin system
MIVVLDTNLIVSALLSPNGIPGEIVHYMETGEITVATSSHLLNKLERVLKYSKVAKYIKCSEEEVNLFIKRFKMFADIVQPEVSVKVIEKDPDDNHVLECAIAARAAFIITGDQHLFELKEFQGVDIIFPSVFVTWFTTRNKVIFTRSDILFRKILLET